MMGIREWRKLSKRDTYRIKISILGYYVFQQLDPGICLGGYLHPKWRTIGKSKSIFNIRVCGYEYTNMYKRKHNYSELMSFFKENGVEFE